METKTGTPFPLGATKTETGWNFSIYSEAPLDALFTAGRSTPDVITSHPLDLKRNKTGHIYHIELETNENMLYYGYRTVNGNLFCLDPYTKLIDTGNRFGNNSWKEVDKGKRLFGIAAHIPTFDWESVERPHIPLSDLIIYEAHVRAFTQHHSSSVTHPGTFRGFIEKIPHLKELGINAVELLPVYEWNEAEYHIKNPLTGEKLFNFWGYSPLSFFCPMQRYSTKEDPLAVITEFKELVRELHRNKIEVILDVVYNHTGEGNENGPTYSFKALSPHNYYLMTSKGDYKNYSGCGNTLNCNNPVVQDLIIDSLRYWASEFQIDGFRFDLASILTRDRYGKPLQDSPLLDRITQEQSLQKCKLIAEPWDAAGLHLLGGFYHSSYGASHRWHEWNDDFRSATRRFIKGDLGVAGHFATKISGSQDVYGRGGNPLNSINYVTCHDGFSLKDLVSYNHKHNDANGEDNRDGMSGNDSWNCGTEGPTKDAHIIRLRERQMKNLLVAQFLAIGIPMMQMGDEYGLTKMGNNNTWCQDNDLSYFSWKELKENISYSRFVKSLIHFRKSTRLFKRTTFLKDSDVTWHGIDPEHPDWSYDSKFVAYTLHDKLHNEDVYVAFNANPFAVTVTLPKPLPDFHWVYIINTNNLPPHDFVERSSHQMITEKTMKVEGYTSIVLQNLPDRL